MFYLERKSSKGRYNHARFALAACTLFAAATFGASPAFAQDDNHFTGFKVEALTGYDDIGIDFDKGVYHGGKNSQSGWMYGLGVGYDYQTGPWVFGVEGDWTNSTADRDKQFDAVRPANPIAGVPVPTAVVTHLKAKASSDIGIGLRVGYAVAPQALLYVKGGWSFAKIAFDGHGTDNNVPFTFGEHASIDGFRIGAGGEYMFSEHIYAKAEYRFTNYNNGNIHVASANASLDPLFDGVDMARHQFLLGIGVRF
jgi:outer membrane immunogenic protein